MAGDVEQARGTLVHAVLPPSGASDRFTRIEISCSGGVPVPPNHAGAFNLGPHAVYVAGPGEWASAAEFQLLEYGLPRAQLFVNALES